ncbi:hypothetical protein Syun_019953 [Stephania yunnanensis]|uniref:START domain-containing protein n=1 Tax=Stephania yunnanensis TaxID=152371 RepID=A0AAP0NZW3_9MAGN
MALLSVLLKILRGPSIWDVFMELMLFLGPIWVAVVVGVVVGWAWKPKWVNLGREKLSSLMLKEESSFGFSSLCSSVPSLNQLKMQLPSCISWISDNGVCKDAFGGAGEEMIPGPSTPLKWNYSGAHLEREKSLAVTGEDLEHLCKVVEEKDGGPAWIKMMERSTPNMSYQAWRRDPETGPPQYRSRTVYEDATPELLRDFFWDDEFRAKWDDMLIHANTLEECPTTGTMVVHWTRKFPFFCSDREYIIGRRIWESERSYYCVTKGIPCSTVPRRDKPRRVDLYYSSWFIRAAESKRDGRLTACEVILFHHEDMGIPWEIAKLGVRQGMWGTVKKVEAGVRAYKKERASDAPLSRSAHMAQINTKINADYLRSLENTSESSEAEADSSLEKPSGRGIPKFVVIGGAVALAFTLDRGLLTKAVIFGVARRFAKIGRGLQ